MPFQALASHTSVSAISPQEQMGRRELPADQGLSYDSQQYVAKPQWARSDSNRQMQRVKASRLTNWTTGLCD